MPSPSSSPRRRKAEPANPAQTSFADLLAANASADIPVDAPGRPAAVKEEAAPAPVTPPAPAPPFLSADLVPVYGVKLVRLDTLPMSARQRIHSPRDVVNLLFKHLDGTDRENFVAVLLDTKGHVIGVSTISVGDLSSAIVHPREVFKPAILANAASILLAHNHPSGDPTPSPEDGQVTKRLMEVGEVLGIDVLDHVVIGTPGRWVSMKERGLVP